ncbi:MAG: hypothetical protein ACLQVG_26070 [Terriglobia bacterium]
MKRVGVHDIARLAVCHILYNRPSPSSQYLSPGSVLESNLRLFRETPPAEAEHEPLSCAQVLAEAPMGAGDNERACTSVS